MQGFLVYWYLSVANVYCSHELVVLIAEVANGHIKFDHHNKRYK